MTYALFPQIGLKFLQNRDNPDAFEPAPWINRKPLTRLSRQRQCKRIPSGNWALRCGGRGKTYQVSVGTAGELESVKPAQVNF